MSKRVDAANIISTVQDLGSRLRILETRAIVGTGVMAVHDIDGSYHTGTLGLTKGGTNRSAAWTASRLVQVASGGTALESASSTVSDVLARANHTGTQPLSTITGHDKAAHDLLGIDADTLDGIDSLGFVPQTLAAAKGDLVAASAAGTWGKLSVSGNDGYALTEDAASASGVKWAAVAAAGRPNARITRSANLSVANATWAAIPFDAEVFDVGPLHSTTSNISRITIPSGGGGKYLLVGAIQWAAGSGIRLFHMQVNGVTSVVYDEQVAVAGRDTTVSIMTYYELAAGDYVELTVYQDSGAALDIRAGSDGPVLSAVWLET